MRIQAIETPVITINDSLEAVIGNVITAVPERSVLVIASKAFSFTEKRLVQKTTDEPSEKQQLIRSQADYFMEPHSQYNLMLTIKGSFMYDSAGVDESNSNGQYSLWPSDPQASVNRIWRFLRNHYHIKEVGVIMTDSIAFPLNWGVIGHGVASCGFGVLKSYIGKTDIFGRKMKMEQTNIMHSLAAAATLEMGEGDERRPLALVTEIQDITFTNHEPTEADLASLRIAIEDDEFAPLLARAKWKKGKGGNDHHTD